MKRVFGVVATAALVAISGAVCGVVSAQSLADVARSEQARRKTIKEPARVYTNEDVQGTRAITTGVARAKANDPAAPASPGAAADSLDPGQNHGDAATQAAKPATPEKTPGKSGDEATDEAGVQSRLQRAREDVARSKRLLDAMQQQLLALSIALSSAVPVDQVASYQSRQQEASREVERLRAELEKSTAALSQLEEQARTREGRIR